MFSGGTGTKEDPFLIATPEDLEDMKEVSQDYYCFKQIADIDFEGADWFNPSFFMGFYDGQNYKISNLNIVGNAYPSMFGAVYSREDIAEDGKIAMKNIRLVNVKVEVDMTFSAALAGFLSDGYFVVNCHAVNCRVDAPTESNIGGLIGAAYSNSGIIDCSVSGYVRGQYSTGALVGTISSNVTIKRCKTNTDLVINSYLGGGITGSCSGHIEECEVRGTLSQPTIEVTSGLGVLVGSLSGGTIERCTAYVDVLEVSRQISFVGLVRNNSKVKDCYANVNYNFTAKTFSNSVLVGGIASSIYNNSTIENCYTRGSFDITTPELESPVQGMYIGGIAGKVGGLPHEQQVTLKNNFSIVEKMKITNISNYDLEDFLNIGRIAGNLTGETTASNYAYNQMTFNGSTTFLNEDKTLEGKDGEDITLTELRDKNTYIKKGWDFENVWDSHPNYNDGFPYLRCFGEYKEIPNKKTIKVYKSAFNQPIGDLKAVIKNAYDDSISDTIDGNFVCNFTTVIDDEKSKYLEVGNIVEIENEYFRIVHTEENRSEDDTLTIEVQGEHVSYDLMSEEFEKEYFTADGTPFDMLIELLDGTIFNVGHVDEELQQIKTISIQEPCTTRDIIFFIASIYGAEVEFSKFTISIVTRRGEDRGFYFAYRKNIKGINRIVDGRKRVNGQPTVSYGLSIALLEELLGSEEHFRTGDTVKVYDEGLKISIQARILSLTKDFMQGINGEVEIGNYVPDVVDSIYEIERSTVHKGKVYNGIRISAEDGFVAERSDKMARNTMNATFGNMLELGDGEGNYEPVFYVTIEGEEAKLYLAGNAVFTGEIKGATIDIGDGTYTVDSSGHMIAQSGEIRGRLRTFEGNTLLLDLYKNANGGEITLNRLDGMTDVKIESEDGEGNNVGGTIKLFNNGNLRVYLGTMDDTDRGQLQVHDGAGNLSYINATTGVIKGQLIATVPYIRNEAGYKLSYDSGTNTLNLLDYNDNIISSVNIP